MNWFGRANQLGNPTFIVFWSGAGWIPCSNVAVRRQTPWRPDGTTLRIAMLAVAEGSPLSISDGGQGKSPWGVWVYPFAPVCRHTIDRMRPGSIDGRLPSPRQDQPVASPSCPRLP